MAEMDRQQADQQLTAILNRALKAVPLVKLDAVDDVMKLFTEAVELMESSLELDDEDERAANLALASNGGGPGSAAQGQSKLLSLASAGGSASTATTAGNSSASSSDSESSEQSRGMVAPLQNKAIAGVAMTVDYSSPSSKTRSLGKQPAPKAGGAEASAGVPAPSSRAGGGSTALGIGLKSSGGGGSGSGGAKPVLGLGLHGAHKPSSRATVGLSALSGQASPASASGASPVSPTTPDSAEGNSNNGGADTPEGIAGAAPGAHLAQAKNKLVAKISGAPQSREYPSPKLGPRSLSMAPNRAGAQTAPSTPTNGSAPPNPFSSSSALSSNPSSSIPPAHNAAAAGLGLSLPMPDSLGRDNILPSAGAASPDADDEGPEDESETGDLIRTDKKNSVFNRVKSTLPITASPKQIRSSFVLLELATSNSLLQQDQEEDLTTKVQGSAEGGANGVAPAGGSFSPSFAERGVLSALPTGLTSSGLGSTPKPAYLRRLDSPETHHGQLIAAKARLQLLINRGLQVADKVRLDKVPEIKASLERALAKLEASLVTTVLAQ